MITYKLTLKCSRCGCDVTIENEKPKWRRDNHIVNALNVARAFVVKHPMVYRGSILSKWDVPELVGVATMVSLDLVTNAKTFVEYKEFHFIDCPACISGRCYLGSGLKEV